MLFSALTRKNQIPRHKISPFEIQVLVKRRQVSAGGSRGARSPDPAQLSSVREPSAWTHLALRPPKWQGPAPTGGAPWRPPLPLVGTGRGRGEVHCGALAGALELCRIQPPVCPLGPPDHPAAQGWVSWRAPSGGWGLPPTALST